MARILYSEIYRSLRERIVEGKHPVGSLLPSEQNLSKEFSCSRMTVRKAISLLANEGLVQSIKGKGVLVIETSLAGASKEGAFTVNDLFFVQRIGTRDRSNSNVKNRLFRTRKHQ